jgi:Holliday junction resolvase RusA-like endonuclease
MAKGHVATAFPYEFMVPGSPVTVNRYGTAAYRNWRADVYYRSIASGGWSSILITTGCTVQVRYFWHLDRRKDVDNILKAIFDGLDGKIASGPKQVRRVLDDDHQIERVVSQRTKIRFHTRLNGKSLRSQEFAAAYAALSGQAAVFVSVGTRPNHGLSVTT